MPPHAGNEHAMKMCTERRQTSVGQSAPVREHMRAALWFIEGMPEG